MKDEIRIKGFRILEGVPSEDWDKFPIEFSIPAELSELALGDGDDWDLMCSKLPEHGLINPIGKMMINSIRINNEWRDFH